MKFVAGMKHEEQRTEKKLEDRIDKIQDSTDENDREELETLKH